MLFATDYQLIGGRLCSTDSMRVGILHCTCVVLSLLQTGDIIVFKGLMKMAQNDDQLAVVLAHELAHVYLSHGVRYTYLVTHR